MNIKDKSREIRIKRQIRCGLCRRAINDFFTAYQSGSSLALICKYCAQKFPQEDLELMLNLLGVYGGYFGKKESKGYFIKDILNHIFTSLEDPEPSKTTMRLMHKAILHGVLPDKYVQKMRESL